MNSRHALLGLLAGFLLMTAGISGVSAGDDPAGRYAEGQRLLAAADFGGALKAFGDAAAADRGNAEFQQQFSILRQVVQLREAMTAEKNPQKRDTMSRALRSYYYDHGLYAEALPLDQQRYEATRSADTAAPLAETLLELGRNAEAESAVGAFAVAGAPPAVLALHGIAQARLGRLEPARASARGISALEGAPAAVLYHAARLQALVRERDAAVALLARAFQATPPSGQPGLRDRVRACPDFSGVAGEASFATALAAASTVPESKCSMGPSCGSCPRAKACGGAAAAPACGKK